MPSLTHAHTQAEQTGGHAISVWSTLRPPVAAAGGWRTDQISPRLTFSRHNPFPPLTQTVYKKRRER